MYLISFLLLQSVIHIKKKGSMKSAPQQNYKQTMVFASPRNTRYLDKHSLHVELLEGDPKSKPFHWIRPHRDLKSFLFLQAQCTWQKQERKTWRSFQGTCQGGGWSPSLWTKGIFQSEFFLIFHVVSLSLHSQLRPQWAFLFKHMGESQRSDRNTYTVEDNFYII